MVFLDVFKISGKLVNGSYESVEIRTEKCFPKIHTTERSNSIK